MTLQSAAGDGALLSHEGFVNSSADVDYPMKNVKVGTGLGDLSTDEKWVLCDGKADASNEYYVSIQSENKSGLYLTAQTDGTVVLAQMWMPRRRRRRRRHSTRWRDCPTRREFPLRACSCRDNI